MRRAAALLGCLGLAAAAPAAAQPSVVVEPARWGLTRSTSSPALGIPGSTGTRGFLGLGVGVESARIGLGVRLGRGASSADFGLLEDPGVRIEQRSLDVEVRVRLPGNLGGWGAQLAVGVGRLEFRPRPGSLTLNLGGENVRVDLPPTSVWTRHLAAEVLHPLPAGSRMVLRAGWRFYGLEAATPSGVQRQTHGELQLEMAIRVALRGRRTVAAP